MALGNPESVTPVVAYKVKDKCLNDFKELLLNRAIGIQKQFEHVIFSRNCICSHLFSFFSGVNT